MLLTVTASCLKSLLVADTKGKSATMKITDLPAFAREKLGLHGVNLTTDLLAGADRARLEAIRERADKAACSCLLLVEPQPLAIASTATDEFMPAVDRMKRVLEAARYLGCNSTAFKINADTSENSNKLAIERLKKIMEHAEKLDLNVLISPFPGLTLEPEKLTELIKKVGGFRIGTFPDFQLAAAQKDPGAFLRRIVPYASAVSVSTLDFKVLSSKKKKGDQPVEDQFEHAGFDFKPLIDAIESVGYDGNLAIDYRGPGDPTVGVVRSRKLLESFFADPVKEEFLEEDLESAAADEPDEEGSVPADEE